MFSLAATLFLNNIIITSINYLSCDLKCSVRDLLSIHSNLTSDIHTPPPHNERLGKPLVKIEHHHMSSDSILATCSFVIDKFLQHHISGYD